MSEKIRITKVIIKKVELKKLRKKAGLSLRQLGELSGIHFSQINKTENGYIMNEENWDKIVKVLNRYIK